MGIGWRACAAAIRAARVAVMAGNRAAVVVVVVSNMCKPSFCVDSCAGCGGAARVLPAPGWRGFP